MTTRAEQAQRDLTGGERVERYPRTAAKRDQSASYRQRRGQLHRISRGGEVLHSQAVHWDEWPKVGRACSFSTALKQATTWLTPRVTLVDHTRGADQVEFTVAGGARFRLVVDAG